MKRILSFTLALCMVLSLMATISFSVFAEQEYIAITGVTAPVVGQPLATDGITGTPEGFTLEARWEKYDYTTASFQELPAGEIATENAVYQLRLDIESQGTAYIPDDNSMYIAGGTINGEEKDAWFTTDHRGDGYYGFAYAKNYVMSGITYIDTVTIEALPAQEVGTPTDLSGIVLPAGAPYRVDTGSYWFTPDGSDFGTALEDNRQYELWVCLVPNEGYWFSPDVQVNLPQSPVYQSLDDWGTLEVDFTYDLRPVVTEIDLTVGNTDHGQPLASVTVPENADYTVDAQWATWNNYEGWTPATGSFGYGEYRMEATLYPAEGLTFTDNTDITINGTSIYEMDDAYTMDWTESYITVALTVNHSPANGFVNYVTVSGVPEPIEPGAAITAPALPQITYGEATVTGVQWVDAAYAPVTGKFQDGKLYYLAVSLKPNEGYAFQSGYCAEVELPENGYDHPWVEADAKGNAVVYVRYSLMPTIDKVDIILTEPQLGAAPAEPKVPDGAKYTIDGFGWYAYNGDDVVKFEAGNRYYLDININVAEGYALADDVEYTINGKEPYQYGGSDNYAYICGKFSFMDKVSRVDITIPEYKLGDAIKLEDVKVPEGAKYTINQEYSGWNSEDTDFTGTVGKDKYYLYLNLYAADKHEFTEDVEVYINGKLWEDFYNYDSGSEMEVYYDISFRDVITKVEFPALPSVNLGDTATAPQLQAPAGAHYQLNAEWYVYVGDYMSEPFTGVFADKTAYYLSLSATADEGYEFAEDVVVTVGGQSFSGIYMGGEKDQMLAKLYSFGLTVIDKVELTTDAPEDGKVPGKVTAPENAGYTVEDFSWGVGKTDDFYEADSMKKNETFAYDNYYFLYGQLKAKEGYIFADNAEIYVNGQKVEETNFFGMPAVFGDIAIVQYGFGQLLKPVTPPTGDTVPVAALVILSVLALAGMAVVILSKKKFAK